MAGSRAGARLPMWVGMPVPRQLFGLVALIALVAMMLGGGPPGLQAQPPVPGELPPEVAAQPLRFDPAVTPGERDTILAAIAGARPEARALIDRVDGLVTVRTGGTGADAVGLTEGNPQNGYTVTLDLAATSRRSGQRGVSRLVLHELGHVVDHALLTPEQQRTLDAAIPKGYACPPGEPTGACAPREERFAETFAKWATGDIGVNISLGYKVLPPPSLDAWGAGLPASG
jgi:hypothetical protein